MKKLLLSFILSFVCQSVVVGQVYWEGYILSEQNKPIEFANVVVSTADSSFITGCVTNSVGKFNIVVNQRLSNDKRPLFLNISCIGYESIILPLFSIPQQDAIIILHTSSAKLSEVVIEEKRRAFTLKDGTFVANVGAVEALKNSGSIDDLLNQLPFVQSRGGGTFSVLGVEGNATLYLDGHKVQDPSILQKLRSQDIVNIEVINTPGVQYKASIKSIIKIKTNRKQNNTSFSANQYALQQRLLSLYTGISVSHSNKLTYWDFSMGYSRTAMNTRNNDYYGIKNNDSIIETINYSEIKNNSNFLMGSFSLNTSPFENTNIGISSNINLGKHKFGVFSKGLKHIENKTEVLNTPFFSQIESNPFKLTSSLYYNGKIGSTNINVTDDILLGRTSNFWEYKEFDKNSTVITNGFKNYAMNSLMVSLKSFVDKVEVGYGGEITVSYNKSNLIKNEDNIQTEVLDSKIKNKQSLWAVYGDIKFGWSNLTFYGGLRYEYEITSYVENEVESSFKNTSPHFLNPTISVSYSGQVFQVSASYRRTISRPSYSSLNNFIALENQYVYKQGNPYLRNRVSDIAQIIANYKKISFNANYSVMRNFSATILTKYGHNDNIVLKRIVNLPYFSKISLGVDWRNSYGFYSPSVNVSFQQQFLTYDGKIYDVPMLSIRSTNYFDVGKGWRCGIYGEYTTERYYVFLMLSRRWNYRIMLSKSIKNFTFDFNLSNLFIDDKQYRTCEMNGILAREIEEQDFSGVSLNIAYRFNSVKSNYRNRVSNNESKRF
ncbi:MAG: outer membrane beta-barrel protein [Porphyromonadaceae bacterium]|nr:outer membrane beta-barrel protein [Porphyromonadaceae bacterium]